MPRPKRNLHATAALTTSPPDDLPPNHTIARVVKAAGNNLYTVELPSSSPTSESTPLSPTSTSTLPPNNKLAELPSRFRNTIYLKRNSFVVLDTAAFSERDNKLGGEIVNIVRSEKEWRRMGYWPVEFVKKRDVFEAEDGEESEEESRVGKMPPSESEGEEEGEDVGEIVTAGD